jgi:dephospho-CoA kinase
MILALTGTNGAGKGTVVDYLIARGAAHHSMSGFITEEVRRRGMPVNRDSMREVGNSLRAQHHPAYVAEALFLRAKEAGGDAVIEAVRAIGEAEFLKKHGIPLIAVDADRRLRYERIAGRGSDKDAVSFEEFSRQEDLELAQEANHEMNINGVIRMADVVIHNDGTLEELHAQVDAALAKLR